METKYEIIAKWDESKRYNEKKFARMNESDLLIEECLLKKVFFFGKISFEEYHRRLKIIEKALTELRWKQ
jgi:hypothetical protein